MVDKLNINYSGTQINAEPISVPASSPFTARTIHNRILKEETSTIEVWQNSDKSGSWLTEEPYTGTVSATGKFQVDYDGVEDGDIKYRNTILFHAAQANTNWFIWYKSIGDVYDADDFNAKIEKIVGGTEDNLIAQDSTGGVKDAGKKVSDLEPKIDPKGTAFNKNFGTTDDTVCEGDDSRLSNARTPLSHKNTHITGGSDIIPNAVSGGNSGLMSGSDKQNLDDAASKKHTQGTDTTLGNMTADINMNSHKVKGLAAPTVANDAIRQTVVITETQLTNVINTAPRATTQNLTYYINPSTGDDENDGSSGSPFKTIAKAISLIPQVVNHTVTIYLADGSYSEGMPLSGYIGKGLVYILGNATNPENVVLSGRVQVLSCSCQVRIRGVKSTYVGGSYNGTFDIRYSPGDMWLEKIVAITEDLNNYGVYAQLSTAVRVSNSTLSNHNTGIRADHCSRVFSNVNTGTDNTYGLYVIAATIMKNSTQPGGTTAEYEYAGGDIR